MSAPIWTMDDAPAALAQPLRRCYGRRSEDVSLSLDQVLAPGGHILGRGASSTAPLEEPRSAVVIRLFG